MLYQNKVRLIETKGVGRVDLYHVIVSRSMDNGLTWSKYLEDVVEGYPFIDELFELWPYTGEADPNGDRLKNDQDDREIITN